MGKDNTTYRLLTDSHVSTIDVGGQQFLRVDPEGLTLLAEQAFKNVAHYYRIAHLEQLKAILDDPEASANDRFVALEMLRNAIIAAEGEFPMCQDTGTAVIIGKKGQRVISGDNDEASIVKRAFIKHTPQTTCAIPRTPP